MDLAIWDILAQRAFSSPHKTLDSLKRSLQTAWDSIEPEMLQASSENAKRHFEAVVEAKDGFIEDK